MRFAFDTFVVDTETFEVFNSGEAVRLEPKVFNLLVYLISNRERVVTKSDLVDNVWDGRFISDTTISSAIRSLRKMLGDDGRNQRLIRTAHGQGFRFVEKVLEQESDRNQWVEPETLTADYQDNIKHCLTSDGVSLAYSVIGSGIPIVKVANWLSHIEYDWESPVWAHFLKFLTKENQLLRYDERGNGLSDWDIQDYTFDRLVTDLETVIEASGLQKFILYGVSQGCAIASAYSARHPEKVVGQVLYGGYSRGWSKRNIPEEKAKREAMAQLVRVGWGENNPAFRRMFASLFVPDADLEQIEWYIDLQKKTTSAENAAKLDGALSDVDVSAILPNVHTPTLVLHCDEDAVVPFKEGNRLAQLLPNARLVKLTGRNHIILEHEPAWGAFQTEFRKFLQECSEE